MKWWISGQGPSREELPLIGKAFLVWLYVSPFFSLPFFTHISFFPLCLSLFPLSFLSFSLLPFSLLPLSLSLSSLPPSPSPPDPQRSSFLPRRLTCNQGCGSCMSGSGIMENGDTIQDNFGRSLDSLKVPITLTPISLHVGPKFVLPTLYLGACGNLMAPVKSAKVFPRKFHFPQIHGSFLARKFSSPAVQCTDNVHVQAIFSKSHSDNVLKNQCT